MMTMHRPELAIRYCDELEGSGISDARSGLFLAAPRRTGKSTFLREDLVPALENRGWLAIYVDLWKDKSADPRFLIEASIKEAIAKHANVIAKMAKRTGLDKINVKFHDVLTLDFKSPGLPSHVSLTDALHVLHLAAKMPVVLIVDEAQHAITSDSGMNAMFALKAARDHMNQNVEGQQRLYLVFTGSNQDKLSRLITKKDQPFYGCRLTKYKLLGRDFTDAFTEQINGKLNASNQISNEAVWKAFQLVGHRPEMLRNIISDFVFNEGDNTLEDILDSDLEEKLNATALAIRSRMWEEMESTFSSLTDMQQAVLVHLIETGDKFEPFAAASIAAYREYTRRSKATKSEVQKALLGLREKGVIWQAAFGDYALEEPNMAVWYRKRIALSGSVVVKSSASGTLS